jgi:DNA polymerase-3 subunit alpha
VLRVVPREKKVIQLRPKLAVPSPFFHLHAHSMFSAQDALPNVKEMVAKAKANGQPGLALTDHGNMAGSVQLMKESYKAGLAPYCGSEMYFVHSREDKRAKRYHLGLVAYNNEGYRNLVRISSQSHTRENFHHKPLIDWNDLAMFKEKGWMVGLVITTGCFFGVLVQDLINNGYDHAKHTLFKLSRMGEVIVEVQRHNIDQEPLSESELCDHLYALANEVGLPVVATQDAHYVDLADQPIHDSLKRIVAFGDDPDEAVFPGDGFHLSQSQWVKDHHTPAIWSASEATCKSLMERHDLNLPELKSYSYKIPETVADPVAELRAHCEAELKRRNLPKVYWERLEQEMDVLTDTGMCGYIVLVKEVTDWLRKNDILFQARGSAGGSLLCWLCGITPVDPIHYKLLFERFVSRDRMKPPDIDLDIEDQRRGEVLTWLKSRFASSQIGTWAKFSIDEAEGRGSLIVAYKKVARARGLPVEDLHSIEDIPEPFKTELLTVAERKTFKSAGVNAAGLIVASDRDYLNSLIPSMGIPKGTGDGFSVASQFHKKDVEDLGIVKLDVMGLKNLTALRLAKLMIEENYGEMLEKIPLSDPMTFGMIRRGDTDGIFQLEGGTARRGCRELKVRSLKDIIVIMALYRPAVMATDPRTGTSAKDTYLARREGREKVPERHPILMGGLKETYGLFVFQEQVIHVLREIGFASDDLTSFLAAVKASNSDIGDAGKVILGYETQMRKMCLEHGFSQDDIDFVWDGIKGFAEYSFNRAHSTVYGLTAYYCAYLKAHHPLEYATALLQAWDGHEKAPQVISTVRKMGISIGRPHVNISGYTFSIDRKRNMVRRGLLSIKGVGMGAAQEVADKAPYASIKDMVERITPARCNGGKNWPKTKVLIGALGKLQEAGALTGLEDE